MESKTHTLLDKNDVNYLFTKGKSVKAFPLLMYSIKSSVPEVVFSVPKKKINKAVDRNKIKRVAREVFRKGGFNGLDIVLLLKNEQNYDEADCFMLVHDVFSNIIKK